MSEDQVGALVLGVVACAVGPFVTWLTGRAATGRLQRNHWAGLRTQSTLASDAAWVAGHTAALPWTRRTAWATVVLGSLTLALALPAPDVALATGLTAFAVVVVGSLLALQDAHRALD